MVRERLLVKPTRARASALFRRCWTTRLSTFRIQPAAAWALHMELRSQPRQRPAAASRRSARARRHREAHEADTGAGFLQQVIAVLDFEEPVRQRDRIMSWGAVACPGSLGPRQLWPRWFSQRPMRASPSGSGKTVNEETANAIAISREEKRFGCGIMEGIPVAPTDALSPRPSDVRIRRRAINGQTAVAVRDRRHSTRHRTTGGFASRPLLQKDGETMKVQDSSEFPGPPRSGRPRHLWV